MEELEFEVVLSSYTDSEYGSDDERMIWQLIETFGDMRVETLLRLILTELSYSDALENDPAYLRGGVISAESGWNSSISLVSHGFVAIQRSNQLSPEPVLSPLDGVAGILYDLGALLNC